VAPGTRSKHVGREEAAQITGRNVMGERSGSTALVTGASSGIGLELSRVMASRGHDLILVARRESALAGLAEALESEHKAICNVIKADLSLPETPRLLEEEVRRRGLEVDILVNNAGFGIFGYFKNTSLERELDMLRVNAVALTELTKRFLPRMLEHHQGRILNVASTAAFQPGPLMAVYYASKAYVLSFGEAIAEELKGTGITVTTLCPGPTCTEFQSEAHLRQSPLIHGMGMPDAAEVARYGYEAMMKGRRVAIPGFVNRALANSVRFAPRGMVTSVLKRIQEKVRLPGA
jgi:short-subunit dehydrogenase